MAEFSGSINTAYYINEDYSLIEVVYTNPNGEKINYMVEVGDNGDYQALVEEGYDLEKLLDGTSEYKRVHAKQFGEMVNAEAQALAEEMLGMRFLMERKQILEKQTAELDQATQDKENQLLSLDQDVKVKTNKVDHAVYDFIRDNNESKEELFKFKLWALEQDLVKEADKSIKSSIRKSTRITSAMAIYNDLL
jgi:Glu-tRNA(Gln) amidotransferase subunit E-like FAD-binding protein